MKLDKFELDKKLSVAEMKQVKAGSSGAQPAVEEQQLQMSVGTRIQAAIPSDSKFSAD